MKKLTDTYKRWLLHRARKEAGVMRKRKYKYKSVNHFVTAWFGDDVEEVLCVGSPTKPPEIICFHNNIDDTLSFLHKWRVKHAIKTDGPNPERYHWVSNIDRKGKRKKIRSYSDYSIIKEISTAAALVIAAEYDRTRRLIGSVPPTINLGQWRENVFGKFYELGFFEIVGLSENVRELYHDNGDIRTMRIISGRNTNELQHTSECLIELSKYIGTEGAMSEDIELALNSALSEAMANVSKHAYPDYHAFQYQHISSWWVTASADRSTRKLTVVMYDQGASIPVTWPRKTWIAHIQDFISNNRLAHKEFEYQDDATYVKGAMLRGNTQTDELGRGEGLPQMKELVDICGAGSLTIWSRGGVWRYKPNEPLVTASHRCSVGGTLIEWVIELPYEKYNG